MNDYKVKAEIVVDNSGEEPKIQKILYECDRTQCKVCSERCHSTFDIKHARKYGLFDNLDGINTTVVSPDEMKKVLCELTTSVYTQQKFCFTFAGKAGIGDSPGEALRNLKDQLGIVSPSRGNQMKPDEYSSIQETFNQAIRKAEEYHKNNPEGDLRRFI